MNAVAVNFPGTLSHLRQNGNGHTELRLVANKQLTTPKLSVELVNGLYVPTTTWAEPKELTDAQLDVGIIAGGILKCHILAYEQYEFDGEVRTRHNGTETIYVPVTCSQALSKTGNSIVLNVSTQKNAAYTERFMETWVYPELKAYAKWMWALNLDTRLYFAHQTLESVQKLRETALPSTYIEIVESRTHLVLEGESVPSPRSQTQAQ